MSVNSRFKKSDIYSLVEVETPSGAKNQSWEKEEGQELVAIHQADQFVSTDRFRHTETSHMALTYCRYLEAKKHRIVQDGKYYEILDADPNHRLNVISLKRIESW